MKTAKEIRRVPFTPAARHPTTWRDQRIYELSEPLEGARIVAVSAAVIGGEPETYIFACDAAGEISSFGELDGSQKGTVDHATALRAAGYEVVE